ncbi:HEPN domain-containing protein [Calothrix sp. CCY 0018]|uniref:HEPN domain-containing protein n=1 Tax=Calothrix sp. CCY 0018 TaxID=3103864 RepID=UPI0039C5E4A7
MSTLNLDSEYNFIDKIISNICFELVNEDETITGLMANSGCSGWGFDDYYSDLEVWRIRTKAEYFGFFVNIHLSGTPNDETGIIATSMLVKLQGKFLKDKEAYGYEENDDYKVLSYEVLEADLDLLDDDYDDYIDAILFNTEFNKTLCKEISSLKILNNLEVSDNNAQKTLKKQIYLGAITCLETYLCDAFIHTVLSNRKYLKCFFYNFIDFQKQTIKMREVFDYSENIEEKAKETMSEVIYHNLSKVSKMYQSILNISFPGLSKISKYISIRHDLVHRNGKNKKGEEMKLDKKIVNEVIDDIQVFINEIDEKLINSQLNDSFGA